MATAALRSITAAQFLLDSLPNFTVDDGFVVVFDLHPRLLTVVVPLFMGQEVRRVGLFLYQIAAILFVLQNLRHGGRRPTAISPAAENTRFPQLAGDGAAALTFIQILAENQPNDLCPLWIDGHLATLYIVAQQRAAEYHTLFHAAGLSPLGAVRGFTAFLLRHGAHDGQSKLAVVIPRVDVVVEKQNAHIPPPKLAGDLQRVHCIAGKTADLLCHDQVDLAHLCRVDHAVELHSLFGRSAGNALVGIDTLQFPFRFAFDALTEIPLLCLKRVGLIFLVCGHAAICRYL